MSRQKIVVVGAGIGGLVAAVELAQQGLAVTVVERAARAGGKLRQLDAGGAPVDSGPTVLTMRWVFDELFDAVGTTTEAQFTSRRAGRIARHAWADDQHLDLYDDLERSADAIGEFAGAAEARRFRSFSDEARRIYAAVEVPFIRSPQAGVLGLMRRTGTAGLADLWQIRPYTRLSSALSTHFRDPRLRQLFGRYAGYCGASPYRAPATLMLVAHVEREGVWLVDGGMYRIVEAVERLARARGVEFRFSSEVREIRTARGRVSGVVTDAGDALPADAVVVNADVAAVGAGLFGHAVSRGAAPVPRRERSMSAITFSMLAEAGGFPLVRHNVFFSADYEKEFREMFDAARPPSAPTVYICAQDRDDDGGRDGAGAERLLCIVNAPAIGDVHRFTPQEIEQCENRTLRILEHCGLRLQWNPDHSVVTTPSDFARLFPATGGALYGRVSHGWRSAFRRPGSRTRVPGLYLAGGSAHPGPGVPMAALSGRLAAASLIEDLASTPR